jgi:hypothetical protein
LKWIRDNPELQRSKSINSSILIAWSLLTIPLAVAGMILDASEPAEMAVAAPLDHLRLVI